MGKKGGRGQLRTEGLGAEERKRWWTDGREREEVEAWKEKKGAKEAV